MKGRFFMNYYYFWIILFVICCLYAIFSPRKHKKDGSVNTHNISFPFAIGLLVIGCTIGLFIGCYLMIGGFSNNHISQNAITDILNTNVNTDIKTDIVSEPITEKVIDPNSLLIEESFDYGTEIYFNALNSYSLPTYFIKQDDRLYYNENDKYTIEFIAIFKESYDVKKQLEDYLGYTINNNNWYEYASQGIDTFNPDEYIIYNYIGEYNVGDYYLHCYDIIKFNPKECTNYDYEWNGYYDPFHMYQYWNKPKEDIYEDIDYYLNDRGGGYWEKECSPLSYKSLAKNGFENVAIYYYGFEPEY